MKYTFLEFSYILNIIIKLYFIMWTEKYTFFFQKKLNETNLFKTSCSFIKLFGTHFENCNKQKLSSLPLVPIQLLIKKKKKNHLFYKISIIIVCILLLLFTYIFSKENCSIFILIISFSFIRLSTENISF